MKLKDLRESAKARWPFMKVTVTKQTIKIYLQSYRHAEMYREALARFCKSNGIEVSSVKVENLAENHEWGLYDTPCAVARIQGM